MPIQHFNFMRCWWMHEDGITHSFTFSRRNIEPRWLRPCMGLASMTGLLGLAVVLWVGVLAPVWVWWVAVCAWLVCTVGYAYYRLKAWVGCSVVVVGAGGLSVTYYLHLLRLWQRCIRNPVPFELCLQTVRGNSPFADDSSLAPDARRIAETSLSCAGPYQIVITDGTRRLVIAESRELRPLQEDFELFTASLCEYSEWMALKEEQGGDGTASPDFFHRRVTPRR